MIMKELLPASVSSNTTSILSLLSCVVDIAGIVEFLKLSSFIFVSVAIRGIQKLYKNVQE